MAPPNDSTTRTPPRNIPKKLLVNKTLVKVKARIDADFVDLKNLVTTFNDTNTTSIIKDIIHKHIIVQTMSCIDYYIHEILNIAIYNMFNNLIVESKEFKNLRIKIKTAQKLHSNTYKPYDLEYEIFNMHQYSAFQDIKKIKSSLLIISDNGDIIFDQVEKEMNKLTLKINDITTLNNERNKIVHQSNRTYLEPGDKITLNTNINTIVNLVSKFIDILNVEMSKVIS